MIQDLIENYHSSQVKAKFVPMIDVVLDENDDLLFENGDLVIGESTNQNIKQIVTANKGEFKESPEIGVGIVQMLNDEEYDDILIEAKKNLAYDGMKVKNISFSEEGKLIIDAKYRNNG